MAASRDLYDRVWAEYFARGRLECGDLEMSLRFLELVDAPDPGDRVLEIGCGFGMLCDALHARGHTQLIGTDISASVIEYGKQMFPYLDLRLTEADRIDLPSQSFEVCLSFDVIEHLPAVDLHLGEVFRLLTPGGRYLFQTPNLFSNALFSTVAYRGLGWREQHCSLQTHWTLRRHLQRAGFSEVRFVRVPLVHGSKAGVLPPLVRQAYLNIPWERLPLALQTNYFVAARKAA